jgi:hypothetical protein
MKVVATSWRRIVARAGIHTMAEPPFHFIPTPVPPPADPSAGPTLAFFLGSPTSGSPVLVPDTPTLALAAGRSDPLSWPRAKRSPDPLGVPPPLGSQVRGDKTFVFIRRLVVGDVSVIHPAAMSYVGDAARIRRFAATAQDASKRRAYRQVSCALPFVPMSVLLRAPRGPALTLLEDLAVQAGLASLRLPSSRERSGSSALPFAGATCHCVGQGAYVATRPSGRTPGAGWFDFRPRWLRPVFRRVSGLASLCDA